MLDDPDNTTWIFNTLTSKSLAQRLFTVMSGSVLSTSGASSATEGHAKRRRTGNAAPKAKNKAKAKAKVRPQSAAGDGSSHQLASAIPEEKGIDSTVVSCGLGVRNKTWVDDLMKCINHCMSALRMQCGPEIPETVFTEAKRALIHLGLVFCFTGKVTVETYKGPGKTFKKWSLLRPALTGHAILLLSRVPWFSS